MRNDLDERVELDKKDDPNDRDNHVFGNIQLLVLD